MLGVRRCKEYGLYQTSRHAREETPGPFRDNLLYVSSCLNISASSPTISTSPIWQHIPNHHTTLPTLSISLVITTQLPPFYFDICTYPLRIHHGGFFPAPQGFGAFDSVQLSGVQVSQRSFKRSEAQWGGAEAQRVSCTLTSHASLRSRSWKARE